jgi:hypothetical protein
MRWQRLSITMCAAAQLTWMCCGCGPSATQGGFDSPNSAARLYAIEIAARNNDRRSIADLIQQLQSDDPAVRMLAIATLERITGETYGYRHFDEPDLRVQSIDRWVQAYRAGTIPQRAVATGTAEPEHG